MGLTNWRYKRWSHMKMEAETGVVCPQAKSAKDSCSNQKLGENHRQILPQNFKRQPILSALILDFWSLERMKQKLWDILVSSSVFLRIMILSIEERRWRNTDEFKQEPWSPAFELEILAHERKDHVRTEREDIMQGGSLWMSDRRIAECYNKWL